MAQDHATFEINGDELIARDGNRVVASGTDHQKVAETAEEYFNTLRNERVKTAHNEKRATATHITTPNGETGKILGRTASLYSDVITVRMDKGGEIRHFDTFVGDGLEFTASDETPDSPIDFFQTRLDESYDHGREGLTARLQELDSIREGASRLAASGPAYEDGRQLHQIVLMANAERNEVREALSYLESADAESFALPVRQYSAVEQASTGRGDDWLEIVAQEMVAEVEDTDFDNLLEEGPTKFVSDLDMGALGNEGVVSGMASEFIHAKTAGYQGEEVEEYRHQFVAATEMARRQELRYRKDEAHKEAATHEASVTDAPDESLFL